MQTSANKVGLVWATMLGGFHLIWSILVFIGVGQMLIDFVFWMHMIHVPYVVGPFEISAALSLVAFTSILGYCMGYVLFMVWNRVHKAAHENM